MPRKSKEERAAYNKAYYARTAEIRRDREKRRYHEEGGKAAQQEYRKANLPKYAAYQRNSRARNPREHLIYQARQRATRDGLPFNITVDTVQWPTHCPVLGIELNYSKESVEQRKEWQVRSNTVTLDRHVNALGYVVGNVFAISHRANRIKSDATAEELMAVARYARDGLPNS